MSLKATAFSLVSVVALALLTACDPNAADDGPLGNGGAPQQMQHDADFAPRYAAVRDAQVARLSHLHYLDSRGVVELRYTDESGEHFDQCDLRLFAVLPDRTALRLSKLNANYAWIGSDETHWWVFRLDAPKRLEVHSWPADRPQEGGARAAGFSVVSPRSILLLAGLAPLPEVSEVRLSGDATKLVAESTAAGQHPRWTFDPATNLPSRIEIIDESGTVIVTGELGEYETAPADNTAAGDWPKVPKRIIVTRSDGAGSVRMQLDEPTARAARIKPQFFDLPELQSSLQPEIVTWREPSMTQAPAPQAQP